jgi:anti-sigma-K factor RskA
MSLSPEDDASAAEFVLGTLDAAERATFAARRLREPQLDEAIRGWEATLAPLAEAISPIAPPRDYLADIEARIDGRGSAAVGGGAALDVLRARMARWRAAAVGAASVAALLAVGLLFSVNGHETAPRQFVAVLQKSPDAPAFAITVDIDTRQFSVRPVAAQAPTGKSYELWIIAAALGPPRSLGVIDAADVTRANKLAGFEPSVVEDATYAVTVEPPGGSPDGKPSGAPVFVGKLIPVGP